MRALGALLVLSACGSQTVGTPCLLVKSDGGFVTEQQARELALPNKVFISVGASECDSRVCLRDTSAPSSGPAGDVAAAGYCSAPCHSSADCSGETTCSLVISRALWTAAGSELPPSDVTVCAREAGSSR